jgi:hypothetical protein
MSALLRAVAAAGSALLAAPTRSAAPRTLPSALLRHHARSVRAASGAGQVSSALMQSMQAKVRGCVRWASRRHPTQLTRVQIATALETTQVSVKDNGGDGRHVRCAARHRDQHEHVPTTLCAAASTSLPPPSRASRLSTGSAWCTKPSGWSCRRARRLSLACSGFLSRRRLAGDGSRSGLDDDEDARRIWATVIRPVHTCT